MTREEMWKEFENQLISETRTPITMSFDNAEKLTKLGIKETVAKWKKRLEQTRWIPVSERLPEDRTYVLTTIKVPNRVAHVRSGWYEGGLFQNDNGDAWKATDMEVIAWMPLPPCYEPQESEDAE